jgi:membrane-bound lytic murein transglycosylase A
LDFHSDTPIIAKKLCGEENRMQFKALLMAGICALFTGGSLAQPVIPVASSAGTCKLNPMGVSLTLEQQCIQPSHELRRALVDTAVYLQTTEASRLVSPGSALPDKARLLQTVEQLIGWIDHPAATSKNAQFDFLALGDNQEKRPVQFGGYFTPVLEVNDKPTAEYKYPVYAKPQGKAPLPSRSEIIHGALKGQGLEIAWTNSPVDYHFIQVQGSGVMRYPDGHTQLLGFAGKNGLPYTSIGRYMQEKGYLRTDNTSNAAVHQWLKLNPDKLDEILNVNQSFVFFRPVNDTLRGSSGLPVLPGHTVSVDTSIIPFGSILLAELALRDNKGKIVQHEWRLLLATDRRSGNQDNINLSIYTGAGEEAKQQAQRFFPAGRAFILQSRL